MVRPYTPISPEGQIGSATFLVKSYAEGKLSRCVCGGCVVVALATVGRWGPHAAAPRLPVPRCLCLCLRLTAGTRHIGDMALGDSIALKGPLQKFTYTPNMKKYIGMIAGGSGITPMLQLIEKILSNGRDNTEVRLIFANQTPEDVLLKDRLDGEPRPPLPVVWLRLVRFQCG